MNKTLAVTGLLAALAACAVAPRPAAGQSQAVAQPPAAQSAAGDLQSGQTVAAAQPAVPLAPLSSQAKPIQMDAVLSQIQKTTLSMNGNLSKLRIEKWRADADQKEGLQRLATSLQKNATYAVPGLILDVQRSQGNVSSAFKLYHNMNVVYEYLSSLADAAGSLGRREEYEPLAEDATALDKAREALSNYIEQTAIALENPPKPSPNAVSTAEAEPVGGGRKIIVEEVAGNPAKPAKKKAAPAKAGPAKTDSLKTDPAKKPAAKPAATPAKSAPTQAAVPATTPATH